MEILWHINIPWMGWNSFLALVPCLAIWAIFYTKHISLKILLSLIWLAFVPNSIYIMTDIIHFLPQWDAIDEHYRGILILQYILFFTLGLVAYYYSIHSFEKFIDPYVKRCQKKYARLKNIHSNWLIAVIHFLIALGVTMGRFLRTNSWQIITDPKRVVADLLEVFLSMELIIFMIAFGLGSEIVYHVMKEIVHHYHYNLHNLPKKMAHQ